jgi:PPE-repeat protein
MNYSVLPPEINSLRMFSGAGSEPMLAAAVAWDGLASELSSAAQSFSSVTSGLAGQAWQGPASAAMAAAAAPYSGWLSSAAVRALGASAGANAVASAFEGARAAMIHPLLVAANRNGLVQLVFSNLFGQNAPAIAAAEAQYEEMWAADVAAMVGYHGGVSTATAQLASWQQALQGLPGLGQVAGSVAGAAAAGDTLPDINTSLGNIGSWNLGGGNNGILNLGSGNFGNLNLGGGNLGNLNLGSGNWGFFNLGSGNIGNTNIGSGNAFGNLNIGGGNANGSGNFGFGTCSAVETWAVGTPSAATTSAAVTSAPSTWVAATTVSPTSGSATSATTTSALVTTAATTSASGSTATTWWASAR